MLFNLRTVMAIFSVAHILQIFTAHFWSYFLFEPPHDKTNKMSVHPAKTQISLGIRPVWSESLLCTQWVAKYPSFLHADSKDSDQTGRMPKLICVYAGRTCQFVGFVMLWLICISHFLVFLLAWEKRHGACQKKRVTCKTCETWP